MIIDEVFPSQTSIEVDLDNTDFESVSAWYPKILGSRFNFVVSSKASGNQNSNELSNPVDRYILKAIRSQSDLIITTGKTARAEILRASKFASLVIITKDPKNIDIPATNLSSERPVFIASPESRGRDYANTNLKFMKLNMTGFAESAAAVLAELESHSPVFETGLDSFRDLAAAGLIDEVCLTVTSAASSDEAESQAQHFLDANGIQVKKRLHLVSADTHFFRFQVLKQTP
jgi:riboflavin biosynthesis pyrimidine reductase